MEPLIYLIKRRVARLIVGRRIAVLALTFTQSCASCRSAHPSNGLRLVR